MGRKKGSPGKKGPFDTKHLENIKASFRERSLLKSGKLSKQQEQEILNVRNLRKQESEKSGREIVYTDCLVCGKLTPCKRRYLNKYRNRRKQCDSCTSKKSSERLVKYQNSLSPEQRTAQSRKGLSVRKTCGSELVRKSWETIKSDPIKYSEIRERRRQISKKMWKETHSESTKERILTAWMTSKTTFSRIFS